jgi:hypothetical protein
MAEAAGRGERRRRCRGSSTKEAAASMSGAYILVLVRFLTE